MIEQQVAKEALQSSTETQLLERIGRWRAHRSRLIERNKGPVPLSSEVTTLLHVIPVDSLTRRPMTGLWCISDQEKDQIYVPHGDTRHHYNQDGFIRIAGIGDKGAAFGYTQIFRSGAIEYANNHCYAPVGPDSGEMLLGQAIEQEIVRCYEDSLVRINKRHAVPTIYLGFSLIGIAGKRIFSTYRQMVFQNNMSVPTRNIFNSPEFQVKVGVEEDSPYSQTLLPLVNLIWQAFGYERTPFWIEKEWYPFGNYQ